MESSRLQLKTGGVPVVLHLSQYDSDREYLFTPYYGTEIYAYQSGAHVYIEATKPDKTVVNTEATYNEDGTVTYKLTDSLTQAAGDVRAKFTWIKDGLRLASASVVFACDAAGINSYARVSESDLETLRNAESKLYDLDGYVGKAESAADRAEAATGDIQSVADKAIENVEAATTTAIEKIDGAGTTAVDAAAKAKEYAATAQTAEEHATAAEEKATAAAEAAALSEAHAATSEEKAKASEQAAAQSETNAAASEQHAAESEKQAELSESWAVGGTGKREGEDKNNAKYWASVAAGAVTGVATFNGRSGNVTPQSGDYSYSQISGTPTAATSSSDGLMSKTDKAKIDGIATGANKTVTDTTVSEKSSNPVSSSGIYAAIKAVKDSIVSTVTDAIDTVKTAIGNASASNTGLMSATDKTKLDGIAEGATKVAVDSAVTEGSSNAASSGGVYTAIKAVKDSIVSTVTTNIATIKTAIGNASTSAAGLMSATDKSKLDGIATGANKTTLANNLTTSTAGSALDATQGKALKSLADRLVDCGTQSLTASGGSVTFTNSGITTSSLIDVYTTIPNITYTAVTVAAGSCTLTFDAQDAAFDVRLCIWNL